MGRANKKDEPAGGEAFIMRRLSMLTSPAWRALPDLARRFLEHLEIEHMRHGGLENGRLIFTYDQCEQAGMRRASMPLAIRQAVALGFLDVTRAGYKTSAEFRVPTLYRLTYASGKIKGARGSAAIQTPTDEWKEVASAEEANARLATLKSAKPAKRAP